MIHGGRVTDPNIFYIARMMDRKKPGSPCTDSKARLFAEQHTLGEHPGWTSGDLAAELRRCLW
jgi:hypothetical protein